MTTAAPTPAADPRVRRWRHDLHRVTASVGAALHAGDGEQSAALVARADAAMYRAKKTTR